MRLQKITSSIPPATILANIATPARMLRAHVVAEAVFGGEALTTSSALVSAMCG